VGGPAIDAARAKAGWRMDELDFATLHEANLTLNASITETWRKRGFRGRVLDAGGRFGNTTSASIPLALALNARAMVVGQRFGLIGFGGGLLGPVLFGAALDMAGGAAAPMAWIAAYAVIGAGCLAAPLVSRMNKTSL